MNRYFWVDIFEKKIELFSKLIDLKSLTDILLAYWFSIIIEKRRKRRLIREKGGYF